MRAVLQGNRLAVVNHLVVVLVAQQPRVLRIGNLSLAFLLSQNSFFAKFGTLLEQPDAQQTQSDSDVSLDCLLWPDVPPPFTASDQDDGGGKFSNAYNLPIVWPEE